MDIQYVYAKKRNQFGRPTNFTDQPAEILAEIVPHLPLLQEFLYRNPVEIGVQNSVQLSEHDVNTSRYQSDSKGVNHTEGGWPKDVNLQEQEQTNRYRKKMEKDEFYLQSLARLIHDLEIELKQNNAIDIYQNYFYEKIEEEELFQVKTVNLYSFNHNRNQMVNHISWQPDGQRKVAVSYGNLDFHPGRTNTVDSLVWDIENPTQPEIILKPNSSLSTVEFNPKDTNQILGGCLNGQVCEIGLECALFRWSAGDVSGIFDLRKGRTPVEQSLIEYSHRESVRNALWLQSKSGTEFFSAAADGKIYWWNTKKLSEPVDKLILDLEKKERTKYAIGITKLEYDSSLPTKFMVGTETGRVVLCTRKTKNETDRINVIYPGHYGSIASIQRHPFLNKIFLSVGDWNVRLWSEEIRDDYIFCTKPGQSYLTDAQWCPGRSAVFVSSTADGMTLVLSPIPQEITFTGSIHIWDLLFKQDEPTLAIKLSEEPITCVTFQEQGRHLACGTKDGNVILTELSDSLCILDRNEKQLVASMFDRETRRTRLLETRSRLKQTTQIRSLSLRSEEELTVELQQSTEQFWSIINQEKSNALSS